MFFDIKSLYGGRPYLTVVAASGKRRWFVGGGGNWQEVVGFADGSIPVGAGLRLRGCGCGAAAAGLRPRKYNYYGGDKENTFI